MPSTRPRRSPPASPRSRGGALVLAGLAGVAIALFGLRPEAAPPPIEDDIPMTAQEDLDAEAEGRYFELRREETPGGVVYHLRNLLGGPILVRARATELDNMDTEPRLPLGRVVPALTEVALLRAVHADRSRPASFRLEYDAIAGAPTARHDGRARYRVPFAGDVDWRVDQGFGGRFSHQLPVSRHALDFGVPVGTPVHAARGGVVMQVQDDYRGSGKQAHTFASRANFVRVLHDDGSMGMYAHLEYYGVGVKVGQRVAAGDLLGLSGNTGYSTGPHLHFAVLVNDGTQEVSVPFDMDGVDEDIAGD